MITLETCAWFLRIRFISEGEEGRSLVHQILTSWSESVQFDLKVFTKEKMSISKLI